MNIEISPKEYRTVLNWYDGILYCSMLDIDGKNDWRLPTIEELNDIYESDNDCEMGWYWSSTEHVVPETAWEQHITYGYHGYNTKYSSCYIRAVRTI